MDGQYLDPEELERQELAAQKKRDYLNVAGAVLQNFADIPSSYELLSGKPTKHQDVVGLFDKVGGMIKSPTDLQNKKLDQAKKISDFNSVKDLEANRQALKDPNSGQSKALKALAPRWGIQVTPEMSGYEITQLIDPKRMMETEAINKARFDNDRALREEDFKRDLTKMRTQHGYDMQKAQAAKDARPPTDGQVNAAGFARRIEQAEQVFDQLSKNGYDRTSVAAGTDANLPGWLQGGDTKSQRQAERNFINAVLRRESGAAISPAEFENAEEQYFPRVGDSPEVVAQKKANRQQKLVELKTGAGKAYEKVPLISPQVPSGASDEAIRAAAAAELARRRKMASNQKKQSGT